MKEEKSVGVQLLLIHMGTVLFRFSIFPLQNVLPPTIYSRVPNY